MNSPQLDLTFQAAEPLLPARVVITNPEMPGHARLPVATPRTPAMILGVTLQSQPRPGASVPVRRAGVADIETAAVVATGAEVCLNGTDGRVAPATYPTLLIRRTGAGNGGILARIRRITPELDGYRIRTVAGTEATDYVVKIAPHETEITLKTTAGPVNAGTVGEVLALLRASSLNTLFEFTIQNAVEADLLLAGEATLTGVGASYPVIGVALDGSPGAGRNARVLLTI